MQKLRDILTSLLEPIGVDFNSATNILQSLSGMSASTSRLANINNISRTLLGTSTAAASQVNALDAVNDFLESVDQFPSVTTIIGQSPIEGYEYTEYEFRDVDEFNDAVAGIEATYPAGADYDIGHYSGRPLYATRYDASPIVHIRFKNSGERAADDGTYELDIVIHHTLHLVDVICRPGNDIMLDADIMTCLDQMSLDAEDLATTNECLREITATALATGEIQVATIERICARYSPTVGIQQVKDMIASSDVLSYVNIIQVVGSVLSNGDADYDDENDYYDPYTSIKYCRDIIGTVVSIIIAAVTIILSIVFKAIAAIISIVISLLSQVVSFLSQNIHLTQAEVKRISTIPVWNLLISAGENLPYQIDTSGQLEQILKDYGWAIESHSSGQNMMFKLYYPTDITKLASGESQYYKYQLIVSCLDHVFKSTFDPTKDALEYRQDPDHPGLYKWYCTNDYVNTFINQYASETPFDPELFQFDEPEALIGYSQDTLTKALIKNLIEMALLQSVSVIVTSDDSLPTNSLINDPSGASVFNAAELANTNGSTDAVKWELFKSILIHWEINNYLDGVFGRTDYDKIYDLLQYSWFKSGLDDAFTAVRVLHSQMMIGNDAVQPSVEFPSLSRSSFLLSLFVTAGIAVTVGVAALLIKRSRKKKAVPRLAAREAEFEAAKKAYQESPTAANAKAVRKANRRLTRAWKKAGKAGVAMYNGFDTGSSSSPVSSAGLDVLNKTNTLMDSNTDTLFNEVLESISGAPSPIVSD